MEFFAANKAELSNLTQVMAESNKYENLIRGMTTIEKTAFNNIFNQRKFEEFQELEIENSLIKAKEAAKIREQQEIEDEKFAIEMDRRNRLRIREEKMRQQIRETSSELRDLETKLRAAYVGKSIRAQLAEKEAARLQEMLNLQNEQELRVKARAADAEYSLKKKEEAKLNKMLLKQTLQDQMLIKRNRNQLLYEEFLIEKKQIDEIIQSIYEEKIANLQEKLMRKEQFRADLEELKEAQKIWKENEQREIEEENKRIVQYLQERDMKIARDKVILAEKKKLASGISEKLGAELLEVQENARQREELLLLLKVEEIEEKAEIKDRVELEKLLRTRLENRLQLDEQKYQNILKKLHEQEDDRQFRIEQLKHLAEKDRIEQLTTEKKRLKIAEHHRAVRELLEDRKTKRAFEMAELVKMDQMELQEKERIKQLIEEERIKILKEHAAALVGFFPPGVLRESDLAILNI